MKKIVTFLFILFTFCTFAQVSYNANTVNEPYDGPFRPGTNLGYFPGWTSSKLGDLAAGNPSIGVLGVGAKVVRPVLPESVLENFGYDVAVDNFEHWSSLGMGEFTATLAFPAEWHRDQTEYCPGVKSSMFKNLHTPIWDGGANGTPYNDDNYFAAYVYKTVTIYNEYVRFWEIWNEPGFDETGNTGWRPPGYNAPFGNWWDSDPQPCDYILHAPIEDYVRTLRIAYEIIKTIAPEDYVVVAGFGYQSFLDAVLRNTDNPDDGVVTPEYPYGGGAYFDVMGLHSYPHFDGTTTNNSANFFERHSDRAAQGLVYRRDFYQEILSQYGYDGNTYPKKQTIATEMNVPRDYDEENVFFASAIGQRNYIMKTFVTAITNNVHQFHVYGLSDRPGRGFGFDVMGLYNDLEEFGPYEQSMNPEGFAMKTTSDLLWNTTYDEDRTNAMNAASGIEAHAFLRPDGTYVYMLWAKTTVDLSEQANGIYSFPSSFGYNNLDKIEWDYSATGETNISSTNNIQLDATPIFLMDGDGGLCIDDDNDGICAANDCNDNNPNIPTTPGTSCNDGNSSTVDDEIQSDGCTCEGTLVNNPSCTLAYEIGSGSLTISGLDEGPSSVLIMNDNWEVIYKCNFNCNATVLVPNLNNGDEYFIKIRLFDNSYDEICRIEESIIINGGPCDDDDNDGVCASVDCDDNDSDLPTTPGTNCNDGDPNTVEDMIQSDGCTCEGSLPPTGDCDITYSQSDGNLKISGLTAPHVILKLYNPDWSIYFKCSNDCDNPLTLGPLEEGLYHLSVRSYDEDWEETCAYKEPLPFNATSFLEIVNDPFLFFNALKKDREVHLNWVTDVSYRTEQFLLERSINGIDFTPIGEMRSVGNFAEVVNYQMQDTAPNIGLNYYRVKQFFNDGTIGYSTVKKVRFDFENSEFSVFPNPTTNSFFVNLSQHIGLNAKIVLFNQLGQTIHSIKVNDISEAPIHFEVEDLKNGFYHLMVQIENQKLMSKKIIVSKL